MRPTGRPPKPIEQKRRLGNPGKRKLPETSVELVAAKELPEPLRPLLDPGRSFWDRVWSGGASWISPGTDIEIVQIICEQIDERHQLRYIVLRDREGELWRQRSQLRKLDQQIMLGLSMLGFTPTDRTRLGLAEVKFESKLDKYRKQRAEILDAEVVSED